MNQAADMGAAKQQFEGILASLRARANEFARGAGIIVFSLEPQAHAL